MKRLLVDGETSPKAGPSSSLDISDYGLKSPCDVRISRRRSANHNLPPAGAISLKSPMVRPYVRSKCLAFDGLLIFTTVLYMQSKGLVEKTGPSVFRYSLAPLLFSVASAQKYESGFGAQRNDKAPGIHYSNYFSHRDSMSCLENHHLEDQGLNNNLLPYQDHGTHNPSYKHALKNTSMPAQRKEKQEMWIGKRLLTESFSHGKVTSNDPCIIFKDLLKSCTTTQRTNVQDKNRQSLEDLAEIAQRVEGDKMSLLLNSKASESVLKLRKAESLGVDDVCLELTLG
ncbi:hypothetical protein GH714_000509 [Hevea brasiliensis]|uniref:Uncharacterized protein n=1 Tax=Hevea brasiliensis TaxID=3981 RepID=A0A6A6LY20_HEVBR|nr:hypothetical protein GH714_000509 [Hevea brasiliensis]